MSYLFIAFSVYSASLFIGGYQWNVLLYVNKIPISYLRTLGYYFVGLFFNNFLLSNLGGDVIRMLDIRKQSKNGSGAVSSVFLDRFCGLFIMFTFAVISSAVLLIVSDLSSKIYYSVAMLLLAWILIIAFLFSKRFARPFALIIKKVLPPKITAKTANIYNNIYHFGRNPRMVFKILLLSAAIQVLRISTHYFLAKSIGVDLSIIYFFLIIPIVALASSLPISLGGLGVRENVSVYIFALFGIAREAAFSFEFLAYIVGIAASLPGGVIFIMRKRLEVKK